ncbi:MAG: hypothetical protein AAB131_10860, partial [Actinomycetota bacterium]
MTIVFALVAGRAFMSTATGPSVVSLVQVRFQELGSTGFWNPVTMGGNFDILPINAESAWFNAKLETAGWATWTVSSGTFTSGKRYGVNTRALNAAGNYQLVNSTRITTFDDTPPETGLSFPVPGSLSAVNSLPVISGTLRDFPDPATAPASTGTVSNVYLSIKKLSDNTWWAGPVLKWQASFSTVSANNIFSSSWSLTDTGLPLAVDLTDSASYFLSSVGVDDADLGGNQEAYFNVRGATFTYDVGAPLSGIALPLDGKFYNTMPSINGVSFDAIGVATVSLSIANIKLAAPNCYVPNGGFTAPCPAWFKASGSNNPWNFAFNNASLFTNASSYLVLSSATDAGNNPQVTVSSAVFTFDTFLPTATLTTAQWIKASVTAFGGTSTDALSGISSVQVAIS